MPLPDAQSLFVALLILAGAILIDLLAGDPPNRFHPTAWMGRLAAFLEVKLRTRNRRVALWNGAALAACMMTVFLSAAYFTLWLAGNVLGVVGFIVVAALMLKLTIAVRGLEKRALDVFKPLAASNMENARAALALIVRRDTKTLTASKVTSAAVETVAESTVDGVTAALFYYSLFGPLGAVATRVINTLDSAVGYMEEPYTYLGRASAMLDTAVNYLPARVTAVLMVAAARLVGLNSKAAWRMLLRDRNRTQSRNAGWTMATMAGALGVELEKLGHYRLGEPQRELQPADILDAVSIMRITVVLFIAVVVVPLTLLLWGVSFWVFWWLGATLPTLYY